MIRKLFKLSNETHNYIVCGTVVNNKTHYFQIFTPTFSDGINH